MLGYLLDEFAHAATANTASRMLSYVLGFVFSIFVSNVWLASVWLLLW